jgi:hypothetical protein
MDGRKSAMARATRCAKYNRAAVNEMVERCLRVGELCLCMLTEPAPKLFALLDAGNRVACEQLVF